MIQCSRAPIPWSGSKWNTILCSQYSNSVHSPYPPIASAIVLARLLLERLHALNTAIAGPKIRIGTIGCTREQASSHRDSNIGGESLSTSVLLCAACSLVFSTQAIRRVYYPLVAVAGWRL